MEDEKKTGDLKQEDKSSADPQDGKEGDLKQEEGSSADPQDDKGGENFYKDELERVKKDRDNYKEGLLSKKEELKKAKEENPSLTEEQVEQMVEDRLNERLEAKTKELEQRWESRELESAVSGLTQNPDKQELIKHHYNNSIQRSGNLRQDLRRALLLADEKKIVQENEELRNTLSAEKTVSNASYGSSVKKGESDDPGDYKLNAHEQSLLDRANARRQARGEKALTAKEFLNK